MKTCSGFSQIKVTTFLVAALLVVTAFCPVGSAQMLPPFEFNTARVEFREYSDGSGDHSRIGFTIKDKNTGELVFPGIWYYEITYQPHLGAPPVSVPNLSFWEGEYYGAYCKYNTATEQWNCDDSLQYEGYYRYKIYDRGPGGTDNPVAPPGHYTLKVWLEDNGVQYSEPLTKTMYFGGVDWQPRPVNYVEWFDTDGNLHVQNDWVHDGPVDEFSPGSLFVINISNPYGQIIGSYRPTSMTIASIPADALALIGFVGSQEFTIQIDSRTLDWTTRVYGDSKNIVPDLIPIRDGSTVKSLCEIPIPGDGASFDVFYDRRHFDPLMVSEPTGGIKFGAYIGNYPDEESRDLVASKFQQVIFKNSTNGTSYLMNAPELYKWKKSYSGEFSLFAGHPSMVLGDWIAKIMYDSQWYEATFTITPQMLEQTPPLPVPRVRVRWQNPFNPCDSGIKIIAPATNGEQYRLRIFDEFGGLVVEDNMTVVHILGKKFAVHSYNRADVLGKRARIETRYFDTDWLTLIDWSTSPPNCNANGLLPGSMARSVTWFETPPPRDPFCGGSSMAPIE